MSEEEKKAIEKLKKLANKRLFEETIYENDLLSFTEYAIINNLIDKLQKENQELKEELDYYKQKESQDFDERDYIDTVLEELNNRISKEDIGRYMTEEEKEAYDNLLYIIVTDIYDNEVRIDKTKIVNEYNESVGIILNYIEKLQKENEEYHRIKKDLIRVNKKIYDVDTIDEMIETIDKLQKENKESKELYNKLLTGYNKLVQEYLELEKENTILEGNKIGLKLAIQELKEKIENEIKELEENEDFYREHNRMYEYEGKISLLKRLLAKE